MSRVVPRWERDARAERAIGGVVQVHRGMTFGAQLVVLWLVLAIAILCLPACGTGSGGLGASSCRSRCAQNYTVWEAK